MTSRSTLGVTVSFQVCRPHQQNHKPPYESNRLDWKEKPFHFWRSFTTSKNCSLILDQLNCRSIISRAFRPISRRSFSDEINWFSAVVNVSAESATNASTPLCTGNPIAPIEVVTTGHAIENASNNFT